MQTQRGKPLLLPNTFQSECVDVQPGTAISIMSFEPQQEVLRIYQAINFKAPICEPRVLETFEAAARLPSDVHYAREGRLDPQHESGTQPV